MYKLIMSLLDAHHNLAATKADPGKAKDFQSTARKIETVLIPLLNDYEDKLHRELYQAVLISGSMKALKSLPEITNIISLPYMQKFMLSQPPAYIREASKRGFVISDETKMAILNMMIEDTSLINHPGFRKHLRTPAKSPQCVYNILYFISDLKPDQMKTLAPVLSILLKDTYKTHADEFHEQLKSLVVIHDAAAASDNFYKLITLLAVLGVKGPKKDDIEHADIEHMCASIFSTAGRANLRKSVISLENFLSTGMTNLPAVVKRLEDRIPNYRGPF